MPSLLQKIEPIMYLPLKRGKTFKVVFSNWMMKRIARIQKSVLTNYESGGVLFGVIRPGELTISFATPAYPDDKRSKTEFVRRDKRHLKVLDSVRRRFGGTIGYLGEWHSHPECIPHPSCVDIKGWNAVEKESGKPIVFLIIGSEEIYLECRT